MKDQSYHFEIKDIVTQFVAAFNNVIISRYNKSRTVVDKLKVKYLYAPKQRVINDLINKAQHVTLPAVAVSVGGVARDESRVFNKIYGEYQHGDQITSKFIPSPVPVNITINMSIVTKYQTDMDQILSNFIPHNNPYIVISWKVPSGFKSETEEIRSEVLWDGSVSLEYPTDYDSSTSYRVTADTTFEVKGWLWPAKDPGDDAKRIFYVNSNFTTLTGFEYL